MGDAGGQKHALPKSTDFEDPLKSPCVIVNPFPSPVHVDPFPAFSSSYLRLPRRLRFFLNPTKSAIHLFLTRMIMRRIKFMAHRRKTFFVRE